MNLDKVLIALFVALLLTAQAEAFLGDSGLGWAYLLLLATGASYVATPAVAWAAHRLGMLDVPQGRKAHATPTALMGGVAVYIAFALTVVRNFSFSEELKGIALGGSLVLAVGLIDDWRELPARLKLAAQLLAVSVLVRYGVVVTFLPEATWGVWGILGEWFITAFWVVGITNALNFLDGMDGLASGISAVIAAFFSLIALQNGQTYMAYLALALAGACIGFLPYNMRPGGKPALVFLGDAGSTFLGFVLAALGVMGDWAGDDTVRLFVPVILLGVPIFDMSFTTFMRVRNGQVRSFRQWVDFTGRDHIHHRLEQLRIGRRGAVLVIYVVTCWLGLSALALKNTDGINALLQVGQSALVFVLLGFFMVFVQRQYTQIEHDVREEEVRNREKSPGN